MKTHRKLFFTLLIASTTGIIHAQNVFNNPAINEEQRLDDLIARMYNPQIEMFARFKMKSSFHKTKRII